MAKRIGNSWSALTAEQNKHWDELWDKYVPGYGKAETKGGEILRAMSRLIYRFFNDGDMVYQGYGNETCNSSYRFLQMSMLDFPNLDCLSEKVYEDRLLDGEIIVYEYLTSHPNIFEQPNTIDSVVPSQKDRDRSYYNDCDEDDESLYW